MTITAQLNAPVNYQAPDLTRHPPRSPRVRLGGFAHLPRLIDKARASVAGTNGDYAYDCPMDARFWAFSGIKAGDFLPQVRAGKSDSELLAYVMANLRPVRTPVEIVKWSAWLESLTPVSMRPRDAVRGLRSVGLRLFAHGLFRAIVPVRKDVVTLMDFLDADDYAAFGGKP